MHNKSMYKIKYKIQQIMLIRKKKINLYNKKESDV